MDYTVLDELMLIKKKGDAANEKKIKYRNEMVQLLNEEGFSDKAEKYINEGFSFEGAVAVYKYIDSSDNQNDKKDRYNKLFSTELFNKNDKAIAYKATLNLLALELNKEKQDYSFIECLIKLIPNKAFGKDGKPFKDSSKSVDKYFLRVLDSYERIESLKHMDIDRGYIITLFKGLSLAVKQMKPSQLLKEKDINSIIELLNTDKYNTALVAIEDSNAESENNKNSEAENNNNVNHIPDAKEKVEEEIIRQSNLTVNYIENIFSNVVDKIKNIEKENKALKSKIKTFEIIIEEKNGDMRALEDKRQKVETQLENFEKDNAEIKMKNFELQNIIDNQKSKLGDAEKKILVMENEIAKYEKVTSVYAIDKESAQTEQLNAIASKLKGEYRDFLDAQDMDMTVDLGENLRYQIESIFKILKKAGINVEER